MPVDRYRSAFDMPRPTRANPDELLTRIAAAWDLAHVADVADPPRGVAKYRSLEAAQAARSERTRERLRRLRASRGL